MLVNYSRISWEEWQTEPNRNMNLIQWDVADTKLLINSEGCGYPPRVNCTEFAKRYGYGSNDTNKLSMVMITHNCVRRLGSRESARRSRATTARHIRNW